MGLDSQGVGEIFSHLSGPWQLNHGRLSRTTSVACLEELVGPGADGARGPRGREAVGELREELPQGRSTLEDREPAARVDH